MLQDFRLKVFQTVALKKNFTKAARILNISQPAVSQNISELEMQIGDILIDRVNADMELTPKGKIVLDYADRILHLYDCLDRELVPITGEPTSHLRIAACPMAAKFILPPIIAKFTSLYPTVEISMFERESFEIQDIIKGGSADLGVSDGEFENLTVESFANLSLSNDRISIKEINFVYSSENTSVKSITDFILTAKTYK